MRQSGTGIYKLELIPVEIARPYLLSCLFQSVALSPRTSLFRPIAVGRPILPDPVGVKPQGMRFRGFWSGSVTGGSFGEI